MLPFTPRLIVEPDEGLKPVQEFIQTAKRSLLIKQFTFTEESLIRAVIDKRNAGLDVRVMLNAKRSGGDRVNDETYERFKDAAINVQWSSPKFYVTHEKSIVVDEKAALVATFNLHPKYFSLTRDYGIITEDPQHVAQIIDVFNADWDQRDWTPSSYEGLLWSNSNSRLHMAHFIDTAQQRLDVQHPKYVDAVILDHIAAAADRGVRVHVLCGGRHGISEWDILDTFASLRTLRRFGVKVHKQKNLRVHAKLLIVDEMCALVGSMNIDRSAFDLRRELGITISDPSIVARLRPSTPTGTCPIITNPRIHSIGPSTWRTTSRTTQISFMSEFDQPRQNVSLFELAWTFNHIALASFGGGLSAWSREVLVVEKHWMEEEEFLSAMTMCRILPGANQVNMAVFVGTKMGGIAGAAAALFGLCLMPVIFILAMAYVYFRFKEVPAVKSALHGASAAAVALTLAMVIKTGQKCLTGVVPVMFFLASFVLNGLVRWPLPETLAVLAPLSLLWAWPRRRAA